MSRVLRACLRAYPRALRDTEGAVVLACAEDLAERGSSTAREALGLLRAGLRARAGAFGGDLRTAPWRDALGRLALPLASVNLLVWTVGLQRFNWEPMGRWWLAIVAAALVCVAGAAVRSRGVMASAAAACLLLDLYAVLAHEVFQRPTGRFSASLSSYSVEVPAAVLPALALLVASGCAIRAGDGRLPGWLRSVLGVTPAALVLALDPRQEVLLSSGPSPLAETLLVAGLLAAIALTVLVGLLRLRRDAFAGPLAALVLAAGAPEIVWLSTAFIPYPGPIAGMLLLLGLGAVAGAAVLWLARAPARGRP